MDARVPEPVQPLLREYLCLMEAELPGLLEGFYVHGSLALDAFNVHSSDIDFIAVVSRQCTMSDTECLKSLHAQVARVYPRWKLSGTYLQLEDLGRFENSIAPAPCYHDGVLKSGGYHDINSVTWWLLKNRGIALVGTVPSELSFSVDWDLLVAWMHQNLNTYWKGFTRKPARMAWLLTDFGIEWVVLGVLRQYYTFRKGDITSKTGAGEYALTCLPARWHRIVREAINMRERKGMTSYKWTLLRAVEAFHFTKYIIRECNRTP